MKPQYFVLFFLFICFSLQAQHNFSVKQLEKIAAYGSSDDGIRAIRGYVGKYGFASSKLYSDINTFFDQHSNKLNTYDLQLKDKVFTVVYKITNPTYAEKQFYINYISKNYRKLADTYFQSGKFVVRYDDDLEKQVFEVVVYNNTKLSFPVIAKKIGDKEYELTPFSTSIGVKFLKGDKLILTASGTVGLGIFAGSTSPNGIEGFQLYNHISNFPHGSLLGKIGKDGNWFLIGKAKTMTVNQDGVLYVRVNDRDLSNNTGAFYLKYSLRKLPSVQNSITNTSQNKSIPKTTGCLSGNCVNGYGTYKYDNGTYYGFFLNNNKNGYGHYSWANGDFYIGNWTKNTRNGYGSYFWVNKTNYIGEWKNNIITGYGVKKELSGNYSRGMWQNGKLVISYSYNSNNVSTGCTKGDCSNGYGKFVYNNKDYFYGFFVNGKRYAGTYHYTNGDLYQGQFGPSEDFSGYGYYLWKNNNFYKGLFSNYKRNGEGYYKNRTNNSEMTGIWRNGTLLQSH